MHILNEQTRKALSRRMGKSYDEMLQMSVEELDALVEERIGKKLTNAALDAYQQSYNNIYCDLEGMIDAVTPDLHRVRI